MLRRMMKKTHPKKCKMKEITAKELYDKYKIKVKHQLVLGHAIGLFCDDDYLQKKAIPLIKRMQQYIQSSAHTSSPYTFPQGGMFEISDMLSLRCAIDGGCTLNNCKEKENWLEKIIYSDDGKGKISGIQIGGDVTECKQLVGEPCYFKGTDKIKESGKGIARAVCILKKPVQGIENKSYQIIIPGQECERKTDIYITVTSESHKTAPEGNYIAFCSTMQEAKDPEEDLKFALNLLEPGGDFAFSKIWRTPYYVPNNDPSQDNVFLTESYDHTTNFMTIQDEVLELYKAITGTNVDLKELANALMK